MLKGDCRAAWRGSCASLSGARGGCCGRARAGDRRKRCDWGDGKIVGVPITPIKFCASPLPRRSVWSGNDVAAVRGHWKPPAGVDPLDRLNSMADGSAHLRPIGCRQNPIDRSDGGGYELRMRRICVHVLRKTATCESIGLGRRDASNLGTRRGQGDGVRRGREFFGRRQVGVRLVPPLRHPEHEFGTHPGVRP